MRTFEINLVFILFAMGTLLSACSGYELNEFYDEMLNLHNEYRAFHDAPALKYDDKLSKKAMECQDLLSVEEYDILYSGNVCYLVYKSMDITRVSAKDVFLSWYNEGQDYDYTQEPDEWKRVAENFTQIVWKSTKKMGFAMVEMQNEKWFIAAYYPAGNQVDQYIDNVGRPKTVLIPFYKEMLNLHNKYRAIHGAPALKYDDELSKKAMECQELYILDENNDILETYDVLYLVYKSKDITNVSAEDVFLSWYNEEQGYDYTQEPVEFNKEHFTQIIWKSTEKLGFAMLEKPGETWFIAAYSPPGNIYNLYTNNVGEPKTEVD